MQKVDSISDNRESAGHCNSNSSAQKAISAAEWRRGRSSCCSRRNAAMKATRRPPTRTEKRCAFSVARPRPIATRRRVTRSAASTPNSFVRRVLCTCVTVCFFSLSVCSPPSPSCAVRASGQCEPRGKRVSERRSAWRAESRTRWQQHASAPNVTLDIVQTRLPGLFQRNVRVNL
ncbi:hypothetical protein PybrP1_001660 [[Pythium] brassicae (nom. inval.)]|nr:hypothetical protein PybrP1_001660 [[Pythium] brassicae (nom. inval.)]